MRNWQPADSIMMADSIFDIYQQIEEHDPNTVMSGLYSMLCSVAFRNVTTHYIGTTRSQIMATLPESTIFAPDHQQLWDAPVIAGSFQKEMFLKLLAGNITPVINTGFHMDRSTVVRTFMSWYQLNVGSMPLARADEYKDFRGVPGRAGARAHRDASEGAMLGRLERTAAMVFAEGELNPGPEPTLPFKPFLGRIANLNAQLGRETHILPMHVGSKRPEGLDPQNPLSKWMMRFGMLDEHLVVYGTPIEVTGELGHQELTDEVQAAVWHLIEVSDF